MYLLSRFSTDNISQRVVTVTMAFSLVIRLSGTFVDGKAPTSYPNTSTVVTNEDDATCRAFENDGECGECRQCWDASIRNISYVNH